MEFEETDYGFKWGPAEIKRVASDEKKGWIVFTIKTAKGFWDVCVTKSGKVLFSELLSS